MGRSIVSRSVGQTKKIAKDLAKKRFKFRPKTGALVVGLTGELGSGKTVFAQGFASGLGVRGRIVSPTFVLMRKHGSFYHIDVYRINKPREIVVLGWKKIINNPQNIILIEWAEKIKKILPKGYIKIKFEHVDKNKRKISFT